VRLKGLEVGVDHLYLYSPAVVALTVAVAAAVAAPLLLLPLPMSLLPLCVQMIWNGLHKDWIAAQEAKKAAAEAAAAVDNTAAAVAAENQAAVAAREAREVDADEEEEGEETAAAAAEEVRHQCGWPPYNGMGVHSLHVCCVFDTPCTHWHRRRHSLALVHTCCIHAQNHPGCVIGRGRTCVVPVTYAATVPAPTSHPPPPTHLPAPNSIPPTSPHPFTHTSTHLLDGY
jgi:hypothetical protein